MPCRHLPLLIALVALSGCASSADGEAQEALDALDAKAQRASDAPEVSPADDATQSQAQDIAQADEEVLQGHEGLEGDTSEVALSDALDTSASEVFEDASEAESAAPEEIFSPPADASEGDIVDIASEDDAEESDLPLEDASSQEDAATEDDTSDAPEGDAAALDEALPEACTDPQTWPKRVLFIGNSYTGYNGGLDSALSSFASAHACSPGFEMTTKRHSPGGTMIHQHYTQANTPGSSLHTLLNAPEGWDVVVLQDQSQVPGFPAASSAEKTQNLEVIEDFTLLIEATGAKLVFFMTWGRRDGDQVNAWLFGTYAAMQEQLAMGYLEYAGVANGVANELVEVAPVGYGWWSVEMNMFTPALSPALAKERFESLYASDGSHPSARGTYLAAGIFFGFLTKSPAQLGNWHPTNIAAEDALWLKEAADLGLTL